MRRIVIEPPRPIPVLDEVDVLVVGGGVAGCAAGWAAAKAGAKTLLVERNGCLGGVATATGMANIGNHFLVAGGEQVICGFAGRLVDELVAAGAASAHWKSRDIPGVCIDSERLKVVLIDMLQAAGAELLTHALGARPIVEDRSVRGVFMESKSGRQAILAGTVVDATGEADLAWQAGAEFHDEQGGSATTLFKLANVDLDRFVEFLAEDPDGFPAGMDYVKDFTTFERNWKQRATLFFPHGGGGKWRHMQEIVAAGKFPTEVGEAWSLNALGMYAVRGTGFVVINSNFYTIDDLDVRKLSAYELHSQKMCYYVAEMLKRRVPGFENAAVASVGTDLGIRTSRYIRGRTTLRREDVFDAKAATYADDVIGVTPVHDSRRACGEYFKPCTADVPFGISVPRGCESLLVASAKSVSTEPRGLIRGMTGCMICGQAAGAAAALAARKGVTAAAAPTFELQRELLAQGVYLGDDRRLGELGLA